MAILNRRGNESDFDATKMLPGEWAVSLDTRYVRMCFAPGICLRMATYEAFENDMEEIKDILSKSQNIQQVVTAINANVNSKAEIVVERTAEAEKYRDEAKMYAENASAVSGVEIATKERAGIIKGGDNYISPDGTLQLITTTSSTTLPNSHAGRLKFNEIVGDIEQDSTEGNQLFGEPKIWHPSAWVTVGSVFDLENGTNVYVDKYDTYPTYAFIVDVTAGETLTVSNSAGKFNYAYNQTTDDGTVITHQQWVGLKDSYTFNIFEGATKLVIFCWNQNNLTTERKDMLNLGTTALPYEPFTNGASPNPSYPQPINGSVVSGIKTHHKNFLEITNVTPNVSRGLSVEHLEDGGVHIYGTHDGTGTFIYILNDSLEMKAGSYILSGCPSGGSMTSYSLRTIQTMGTVDIGQSKIASPSKDTLWQPSIIIASDMYNTEVDLTFYPMAREASIEDDTFEPYQSKEISLSQPITLYNDVLSPQNVERKYKKFTADSSMVNSSTKDGTVYINVPATAKISSKAYCTHNSGVKASLTGATLYCTDTVNGVDANTYKAFLDNNEVVFVYELAESTTEELPTVDQIALNSIPTYDGITYVEFIDVGVQPSVSLDYGTSKIGGMTLEGLLAGINGELQSQLNNDRITALESAVVNNV